ncbi:MAG: GNAT family N-acetyltransferase [Acidobacteriota bacterium]|nr:GNAT family N-acetyltransferase [Acidobacteriota bacterium]MDQ7088861.1 GNAT family N-acetyltransferase [Acidobacteriota bacterium]
MHREVRVLEGAGPWPSLRDAWDRLVEGRGASADLYDTCSWLESWAAVAPAHLITRMRTPAVFEDGRLRALMPMIAGRSGRWTIPAIGYRPRYRVVVDEERPDASLLAPLVEAAAGAGARELQLLALPSTDPQVRPLCQALESSGFRIHLTEGTTECLANAEPSWDEHARRFPEVRRTTRKRRRKAQTLGSLRLLRYGGEGGLPLDEGFETYLRVHAASWKGDLRPLTAAHRQHLLRAADRRRWVRLFVLELAGVPAAAHIWFRLGGRAISYSTVYDQRLASLSLGTIIQWETHQAAWEEGAPEIIDYLPGKGTYKSRLGTLAPRLLVLTALRRRLVAGLALPLAGTARRTARRTVHLARKIGAKVGPTRSSRGRAANETPAPIAPRMLSPGPAPPPCPIERLEASSSTELFLAVAGGWSSPRAMKANWGQDDVWWLVGAVPRAAVRLGRGKEPGAPLPVREIVHFEADAAVPTEPILEQLAGALGRQIVVPQPARHGAGPGSAVKIHHAVLPWPCPRAPAC